MTTVKRSRVPAPDPAQVRKYGERFGSGRRALVVISSTSAAEGSARDTTGPLLVEWLRGHGYEVPAPVIVADGEPTGAVLREQLALKGPERPRFLITSGGTGLNPDDLTPDLTKQLLEREVPGIMHALWARGLESTTTAVMSRGVAGVNGTTFLVNLPGSNGGIKDGMAVLGPLLGHIQAQIEDVRDHPAGQR